MWNFFSPDFSLQVCGLVRMSYGHYGKMTDSLNPGTIGHRSRFFTISGRMPFTDLRTGTHLLDVWRMATLWQFDVMKDLWLLHDSLMWWLTFGYFLMWKLQLQFDMMLDLWLLRGVKVAATVWCYDWLMATSWCDSCSDILIWWLNYATS